MDDSHVIPGLNEEWTLGGAKVMEWMAGVVTALVFQEIFLNNAARSMPLLGIILLLTVFGLAALRRKYPDEERGLRNQAMVSLGLPPPGIPTPAKLQPTWSGAPVRDLSKESYFEQLDLAEIFVGKEDSQALED